MRSCEDLNESLHAYLDGELQYADAREVEQHTAACEGCRGQLSALSGMRKALRRALPPVKAPAALRHEIEALVRHGEQRGHSTRRVAAVLLAAAAGLLIAVGGLTLVNGMLPEPYPVAPAAEPEPMARAVLDLHDEAETHAPDLVAEERDDVERVLRARGLSISPGDDDVGFAGVNLARYDPGAGSARPFSAVWDGAPGDGVLGMFEDSRDLEEPGATPWERAPADTTAPSPGRDRDVPQLVYRVDDHVFSVQIFDQVAPGWRSPGEHARIGRFAVTIAWLEGRRLVFFADGDKVVAFASTAPDTMVYPFVASWLERNW